MTLSQGRFQITRKLGEGGMALVYLANDKNVGVDVVIKVPKPAILADPEFARRFKQEIRSMVTLAHPHIVKVKDVGEHQGVPFYVMELLTGGSLEDRVGAKTGGKLTPMAPQSLADWLGTVAEALDFIHSQGVVHRDIKPANILFDGHGNAFVSDFGIAKAISGEAALKRQTMMTQAGIVLGTGPYLAPEVTLGEKYDGKVDQYALAATVYEVLTCRVPFAGTSLQSIIMQQTMGKIAPLHELVPTLPKALSQVIEKGLNQDPKKRYPDCKTFAKAVLAIVDGVPSTAIKAGAATTVGLRTTCPACAKPFRLPRDPEGKNVSCPACGAKFGVAKKPVEKDHRDSARNTPSSVSSRDTPPSIARPASSKTLFYVLGGLGAGILLLGCAGVVLFLGVGVLGFTMGKGEVAKAQAAPLVLPEPKPIPPAPIAPPPAPPVKPPENPIPPAQAPVHNLGNGVFLLQSMTRVTEIAANAKKQAIWQDYGYDNGVSVFSAWVDPGKSVTLGNSLLANTDYLFLAAGDKDAQAMELEVLDSVTNKRVAVDARADLKVDHPESIVAFKSPAAKRYTLKLTLKQSNNNFPCMCSMVILKRNGWSIAFRNLDDVTLTLARAVGDLNKAPGNRKYDFRRAPNQWSVYGGALSPGSELSMTNLDLGFGSCVMLGRCDKLANRLNLHLTRHGNLVVSSQGADTNEPAIVHDNCLGTGYGLRLGNSSTLPGASLVMMAVVDVR